MRPRLIVLGGLVASVTSCTDATSPSAGGGTPSALELTQRAVTTAVGDTVRLGVTGRSRAGVVGAGDVQWSVADPSIAIVQDGLIIPLAPGTTVVTARSGNARSNSTLTTRGNGRKLDELTIAPDTARLAAGDSTALVATITFNDGSTQPVTSGARWRIDDTNVAQVSDAGVVHAMAPGTTTITAQVQNLRADAVIVAAAPLAGQPDAGETPRDSTPPDSTPPDSTPPVLTPPDSTPADSTPPELTPPDSTTPAPSDSLAKPDSSTTQEPEPTPEPPAAPEPAPLEPAPSNPPAAMGGTAELPRVTVDISMPSVSRTVRVPAGSDLQAALNAAQPGDELVLDAGATFTGSFVLPATAGSGWITVRSAGSLPSPGTRVRPANASGMARLLPRYDFEPALATAPGAHHWRIVGLEITAPASQTWAYALVSLGDGGKAQSTLSDQPHHLILDRVYVHGHSTLDFQRCIALNSGETAIVDSWISDCHGRGYDSQAIAGWNGSGPYRLQNNRLEGAGENLMFGGADPAIPNLVPSDIVIRNNHFVKPTSWQGVWSVKNLFELKSAQRVLAEGNVFENNWADGQNGMSIVWKTSLPSARATWTITQDVTFQNNVVRHAAGGLTIAAREGSGAQAARRFTIVNNLFYDVGRFAGTGDGRMVMLLGDLSDVAIERNTFVHNTSIGQLIMMDGPPGRNLSFRNNIGTPGGYGIFGSGYAMGTSSLEHYWQPYAATGNVLVGFSSTASYPPGNTFLSSLGAVGFVSAGSNDYRLSSGSAYSGAGADASVYSATAGVAIP